MPVRYVEPTTNMHKPATTCMSNVNTWGSPLLVLTVHTPVHGRPIFKDILQENMVKSSQVKSTITVTTWEEIT